MLQVKEMVVTEANKLSGAGSPCKHTLRVEKIKKDKAYSVADIAVPMVPPVWSNIVLGKEVSMIVVCASESEISYQKASFPVVQYEDQHRM